jgi:hypothetical protein
MSAPAFMTWFASGATALLHLRFEHMPMALLQFVSDPSLVIAKHQPIVVVEILDDLKRPAAVQDVAADDFCFQPVGDGCVTGFPQLVTCFTQQQVSMPHELMKRVQIASRAFHAFQCFRDCADGLHRRIVDPVGPKAHLHIHLSHGVVIPTQRQNASVVH